MICSKKSGHEVKYSSFKEKWKLDKTVDSEELFKKFDVFLFDCDGVLWRGNTLIDGALASIKKLFEEKKLVYFITNNSTRSRQSFLEKFHYLGFTFVRLENIICTAHETSKYLHSKEEFSSKKKKIYVIGQQGMCEELTNYNLEWVGAHNDNDKKIILKNENEIKVDPNIGAVVVGMDFGINYYKLQYAQLCINELNAEFIGTNRDSVGNFTSNQLWAGTGSMVAAVEAVANKKPFIIGKPGTYMIDNLLNEMKIDKSKVIMIGDRLDTDIHFASNCKISSILVSTGVTDPNVYYNNNPQQITADYFMISIADLL